MRDTIRIYDNGGQSIDRYTAIDMTRPEGPGMYSGHLLYAAVGFSEEPFLEFGQHVSAMPGRHLGKRIDIDTLPEPAQRFVRLFELEADGD